MKKTKKIFGIGIIMLLVLGFLAPISSAWDENGNPENGDTIPIYDQDGNQIGFGQYFNGEWKWFYWEMDEDDDEDSEDDDDFSEDIDSMRDTMAEEVVTSGGDPYSDGTGGAYLGTLICDLLDELGFWDWFFAQ